MSRITRHRGIPRGGYALVLVVGLVAAVSVLGLAYIDSNSIDVQTSFNVVNASRARYVAESGVEHALYWLARYNPPSVNADGYWPGASGRNVDATDDYYDVTVTRDGDDPGLFKIVSVGHCVSTGGPNLAHRVVVWASRPPNPTLTLTHALHLSGFNWLDAKVTVNGNVHTNNSIISNATINGNLTAVGFMIYFNPPSGSAQAFVQPILFPGITPGQYVSYELDAIARSAVNFDVEELDQDFNQRDPSGQARPDWHLGESNPGGVLHAVHVGDGGTTAIRIKHDVQFAGTVVIDGNLYLDAANNTVLTAVEGFPALVVNGDIYLSGEDSHTTINGGLLCTGRLRKSGNLGSSSLTINGPVHFGQGIPDLPWDYGGLTMNYMSERAWLYNFTGQPPPEGGTIPVTIEEWIDR